MFPVPPGSSTVEISLIADGDGTILRLTHRGLPVDMRPFHNAGWQHALGRLAVAAAGGDPGRDPLTSWVRGPRMAVGYLPWRYFIRAGRKMLVVQLRGRR